MTTFRAALPSANDPRISATRISVATAICLSIIGVSRAAEAGAATRQATNIAAQELAPALQILAREMDVQVVYRSELVGDHRTGGANGNLSFEEALAQLLNGTGLTYVYLAEKAITIVQLPPAANPSSAPQGNKRARVAPVGPADADHEKESPPHR